MYKPIKFPDSLKKDMGIQTHVPCTAGNALSIWAKTSVQQFDISSLIILIFMEDIKQFNSLPCVIMPWGRLVHWIPSKDCYIHS